MSYHMLRKAARVKRYHTVPTTRDQTVGEHSYGVVMILLHIMNGVVSEELLRAALFHDLAEVSTGDIPATTKWKSPELKRQLDMMEAQFELDYDIQYALTENETLLLKYADMMELCMFCKEEVLMGNIGALEPMQNGLKCINGLEVSKLPVKAVMLLAEIISFYRKYESNESE